MSAEDSEKVSILCLVEGLDVTWNLACLSAAELESATHFLIDTDVELSEMDMINEFGVLYDSCLDVLVARSVYVIVALHAYTVDRNTCILHLLHHVVDTVALCRICRIVVVVEKESVWVSLMCELKCLCDELVAAELEVS